MQTYLWLDILFVTIPLALSFIKKIEFYKDFFYILPAMIISSVIFICWDYFFLIWGVWSFNAQKLTGVYWFGLPAEELFFYLALSYTCLFVYFYTKIIIKKDMLEAMHKFITALILLFTLTLFYAFSKKMYTSMASLVCAFMLLSRIWIAGPKSLGYFYKSFVFCSVPVMGFYIILTYLKVLTYQEGFTIGITIFSVPVENLIFFLSFFLLNVGIYDYAKHRFGKHTEEASLHEPRVIE